MERRALATFDVQWPDRSTVIYVSSQGGSVGGYCNDEQKYDDIVNIMVGDFQRIVEYPQRGFQAVQPVTPALLNDFEILKRAGFTKHLLL